MAPGDKGNAQTMGCDADSAGKESVKSLIVVPVESRDRSLHTFQWGQKIRQLLWDRNGKQFARIVRVAFRILHPNEQVTEIDPVHGNARFAESTTRVQHDFEHDAIPRRAPIQARTRRGDHFVGQIRLGRNGSAFHFDLRPWIAFAEFATNGFRQHEGKKLQLEADRIVLGVRSLAPINKLLSVSVSDLLRVSQLADAQPFRNILPGHLHPYFRARRSVMLLQVTVNPNTELGASRRGCDLIFLAGILIRQLLCCASILHGIASKLSVFIAPGARIEIAPANVPVRGPGDFFEGSHVTTVTHSSPRLNDFKSVKIALRRSESVSKPSYTTYHYTMRQSRCLILRHLRNSFPGVSQITECAVRAWGQGKGVCALGKGVFKRCFGLDLEVAR